MDDSRGWQSEIQVFKIRSSTSSRFVAIDQVTFMSLVCRVAGQSLFGASCFLSSNMWLFIHSPRDHELSASSLQPGVCHYGTILACCYGWRRSSKGVCEGTFVKPQTTQCSGGWPGSCSFSLWHHKLSPGCQWLSQSRDIVLTDTQGLSACEISSHSKYGWHHHPGYDVFVLGALFHQFPLLFS